jgi:hypothetical protein
LIVKHYANGSTGEKLAGLKIWMRFDTAGNLAIAYPDLILVNDLKPIPTEAIIRKYKENFWIAVISEYFN